MGLECFGFAPRDRCAKPGSSFDPVLFAFSGLHVENPSLAQSGLRLRAQGAKAHPRFHERVARLLVIASPLWTESPASSLRRNILGGSERSFHAVASASSSCAVMASFRLANLASRLLACVSVCLCFVCARVRMCVCVCFLMCVFVRSAFWAFEWQRKLSRTKSNRTQRSQL